jgi:hypothetical protein
MSQSEMKIYFIINTFKFSVERGDNSYIVFHIFNPAGIALTAFVFWISLLWIFDICEDYLNLMKNFWKQFSSYATLGTNLSLFRLSNYTILDQSSYLLTCREVDSYSLPQDVLATPLKYESLKVRDIAIKFIQSTVGSILGKIDRSTLELRHQMSNYRKILEGLW